MWLKNITNNIYYYLLLTTIGIVFYLLNYYSPLSSDDWHYGFICGTQKQIETILDIFKSQYYHYLNMNGRFIPHFFVQLFDGLLGKQIFNLVNSIIFLFLLHFITLTINNKSYYILTITIVLLFIFLPEFRLVMLWMSGSCNYLWSAVFLLIFNNLLVKEYKNLIYYPFFFIYGVICGWTHEGLVIGLGVAYIIYYTNNKQKIVKSRIALLLGFYVGAILLITSPGSISRLNAHETTSFIVNIKAYILALIAMNNLRISFFFIVLTIFFKFTQKLSVKLFIKDNIIYFIAWIVSFLFIIATKHTTAHSRFSIEFYALILSLKLINKYNYRHLFNLHFINLCFIIFISYTINICKQNYKEYINNIKQIKSGNSIILTNEICIPHPYFERFIVRHINSEKYGWYFMINPNSWYNKIIANYFKKESLTFIPKRVMNDIHYNPNKYLRFVTDPTLPFYILNIGSKTYQKTIFTYKQTDFSSLPYITRIFAPYMNKYNIERKETNKDVNSIININNSYYLFVGKDKDLDFRLKEIILE